MRQVLLRLKDKKIDALFLNPLAESGFIRLIKQLEEVKFHPALYTVCWPTAQSVQQAVSANIDGIVFANLPDEKSLPPSGQLPLDRFRKRFGEPLSAPFGVAYAHETLRLLDEAIRSRGPVQEYLKFTSVVNGVIGPYSFDNDGAVRGISFELHKGTGPACLWMATSQSEPMESPESFALIQDPATPRPPLLRVHPINPCSRIGWNLVEQENGDAHQQAARFT